MTCKPLPTVLFLSMAVATVAANAQQQPGVEIYGLVGTSYTTKNNQGAASGSVSELSTNSMAVSYLGFRGRENLGGSLSAVFRMEATLAPDTGVIGKPNGTAFFDRQSFVGLTSTNWGAVTFGRQFHALTDRTIRSLDIYNVAPANAHIVPLALYGVNRFSGNDNRANNAIKYRLDKPNGLQAGISYAMGEVAGSSSKGSSYSWDLAYVGADFNIGAGMASFNALNTVGPNNILPTHEVWSVGGSMNFGSLTPYLSYYSSTLDHATTAGLKTQLNKITALGLAWRASPTVLVRGAYYMDKGTDLNNVAGRSGNKDTTVISAEYALSKRTSLNAILANNSLTAGYMQEALYTAALGRNPNASSVRFFGAGVNHQF